MVYGYCRCSTNETKQDIDRQIRELKEMGATPKTIFKEYESGTKVNRPEYLKMLDIIKDGDTIVTTEVSRLTRSTKHLCDILQTVQEKKIILNIGGSFVVDCSQGKMDPMTEGMIKMWGVFAEMERNIISQRVISGMKNAAAKGAKIGRPEVTKDNLPDKFWKYYSLYKKGDMSITDFAKVMDISRTTVYKYISIAEMD